MPTAVPAAGSNIEIISIEVSKVSCSSYVHAHNMCTCICKINTYTCIMCPITMKWWRLTIVWPHPQYLTTPTGMLRKSVKSVVLLRQQDQPWSRTYIRADMRREEWRQLQSDNSSLYCQQCALRHNSERAHTVLALIIQMVKKNYKYGYSALIRKHINSPVARSTVIGKD